MEDGKTALYAALYATPQGATSAAMTHLRRTHELETGAVDSEIGTAATDALEPRPRRQKTLHDHLRKTLVTKTTGQLFRETLLGWVTDSNLHFTCIEHPLFRQLLSILNKDLVRELLPDSGNTVKAWMRAEFNTEKGCSRLS